MSVNSEEVMSAVSAETQEMTRKTAALIQADILRRLAEFTQARAATCMGVHASTVSRMVASDLDALTLLLAVLDLKVVPTDSIVCSQEELYMYKSGFAKFLNADLEKERIRFQRQAWDGKPAPMAA